MPIIRTLGAHFGLSMLCSGSLRSDIWHAAVFVSARHYLTSLTEALAGSARSCCQRAQPQDRQVSGSARAVQGR